ncbi:MAG: Eco57I restriction-modification methylase domain-containing protein [Muribaculaceae bacterium]|nr:Eco57I restriction-modification methylase domain-containing protein [Muribaculaceae bacterium]
MATYKPEELRAIFRNKFDKSQWITLLRELFNATELRVTPEPITDFDSVDKGYYLGNIETTDYFRIGLFHYEINAGSVANKRVGLRNLIKPFLRYEFDAALVVFDSGDHWRLSFICDIKEEATSPKRYTYVFGDKELLYRTPIDRFNLLQKKGISFENIKTAFSVEALSNEFFDRYREQYADFIQYVTGKRVVKSGSKWVEKEVSVPNVKFMQAFGNNEKRIRDYIKKMMGRITFLHFLQRKGWLNGDLNYMQNMFEQSRHKDNYLDAVLEPLFFGILNTKPSQRESVFEQLGWDKSLLNKWVDIPYLNGGLFERDAEDEPDSVFPAEYFARLFQFFSEYNFTIDENDPNDAEVGVDPEMLGKIFENLLEDNKDKGAFYTPKEIVRYMCQESLIAYLETNTSIATDKIRQFVLSPEEGAENIPEMKRPKLVNALEDVKICDPAIGSGAFPMGLLNELLRCREALSGTHYDRAEIKKSIIQNSIYGVDIEKGAVDIARLRFWLSIVVDEEKPLPLPNLDYKIMQGNSLIESFMGVDLSKLTYERQSKRDSGAGSLFDDEKNRLQKVVSDLLREYYSCSDHDSKIRLQQRITDTINAQLEAQNYDPEILQQLHEINLAENNKFFLWHTWFSDVFNREDGKKGFDIVIGNPPYVVTNKRDYPKYKWNSDLYKMFYELGIDVLMNFSGHLCFITPKFWMLNLEDEQMRKTFSCNLEIKQIAFCNPFETAVTENTVVLLSKNNNKQDEIEVFKYNPNSLCFENTIPLNLDYCSTNLHFEWVHGLNKQLINLLTKLVNNKKLKDISISKRGAEISKKVMRETIKGIPSLIGQDMKRYSILWCDTFIDAEHKEFYRLSSFFSNKLIYLRRVDTCLEATISTKPYGFNKNVYGIKVDEKFGYKIKFVLALLNSKLLDFYYKKKFSTKKEEAFPEIQTYLYEQLPLPIVNQEQQNKVISIVDTILQLKSGNNNADTSSLENEINVIVYDLYGLTDAEIKVIEKSI